MVLIRALGRGGGLATGLLSAAAFAGPAAAQLTPDRVYYGIDRSIPMTVKVPEDSKSEATIRLLAPVTAETRASAAVVPGKVDLAGLFPILWKPETPPVQQTVYYAQLVVGEQKVGSAVVLQPLLDPAYCVFFDGQSGEPQYRPSRGIYSGLRAYVDKHVLMETTLGNIEFAMRPDQAPNTVWAFMDLCGGGFYTDVIFHRVKATHPNGSPFVVQAGDPLQGHGAANGQEGGPGFLVNLEKSKLPHDFGVISMARYDTPNLRLPNSAGSQFFICLSREGTSFLDGAFTSFGQAVSGAEAIRAIALVEVDEKDRPKEPPVIKKCTLIDAPPYGTGPKPVGPPAPPVER